MTPTSDVYATHFVVRSFCDLRGTFGSEIVSTLGKAAAKGMRVSEPSKAEPGTELIEKLACCVAAIRKLALAATIAAAAYTHCTNLCGCTCLEIPPHPSSLILSKISSILSQTAKCGLIIMSWAGGSTFSECGLIWAGEASWKSHLLRAP